MLNLKLLIFTFLSFLVTSIIGQGFNSDRNSQYFSETTQPSWQNPKNNSRYFLFEENQRKEISGFFKEFLQKMNLPEQYSFKKVNERKDQMGLLHLRYRQYFNGYELAYTNLILHVQESKVVSLNGVFFTEPPLDYNELITKEQALQIALQEISADEYYFDTGTSLPEVEMVYLPKAIFSKETEIVPTYRINIYAKSPLSRTLVFINALTGVIEYEEDLIHTGNSEGTAVTAKSDTQRVITDSLPHVYRLRDSTRGKGVQTFNCLTNRSYSAAVDFLDSNNFWNNFNPKLDEYATDAHWGTEVSYDYLKLVHNYNSIDDSGFVLKSYIHYGVDYVNAFWDGERMTYGDGDQFNDPLTTLDIVGHEVGHGLTRFSAGLIYANESGAINESFSDILGTAVEFYSRPERANWLIGEDIGRAIRSMINPKNNNDPDTYGGINWVDQNCIPTSSNDRCGVHTNSGVQNYWFYLLTEGGIGENDNLDSFKVDGIGIDKAAKIAFRTLTIYHSPSSNFEDARFFSILSAVDLYGACSPEVESTTNAWYAVGVGEKYKNEVTADFVALADTAYCSFPAIVSFKSIGNNVLNYKWDFGNGDTSIQRNPVLTYDTSGVYAVSLIADGSTCGADTMIKTNYIEIDTIIPCSYLLDNADTTIRECKGRLYDSGGSAYGYTNEESGTFTIEVPSSDFIELTFVDVKLEGSQGFTCNRDYIEIFDGPSINDKNLGRYCTEILPVGGKIISSSNAITIQFKSDELGIADGFLLSWECKSASQPPSSDFKTLVDTSCNGIVPFINLTTGGAKTYSWNFGDGEVSSETHPTHRYRANGNYDVELVATNSFGSDIEVKNAVVNINRPLAPEITVDTTCLNEDAVFKVSSNENIEWYADTTANRISTSDSITIFNIQTDQSRFAKEISNSTTLKGNFKTNMGAGDYSNGNDYLKFDVHQPITLERAILLSKERGTRSLEIRNNKGELVAIRLVSVIGRSIPSFIGIDLYPDTAYRISVSDRNTELYKNTSGANYPYKIGDLVTITGSNLPINEFPYFYEWQVSKIPCESNFSSATAYVDSLCVVSLNEIESLSNLKVYPNPTANKLFVSGMSNYEVHSMEIISSLGQQLKLFNEGFNNQLEIDLSTLSKGIYFLKIEAREGIKVMKLLKNE